MSQTEQRPLSDTTVGLLIAQDGTEEVEFTEPRDALQDAGATVDVLSTDTDAAQTVENDLEEAGTYQVDERFADVSVEHYDALVVPGGTVGADTLRSDEDAVALLREQRAQGEPIASICHGPWTLIEADVVEGATLTSYPSLQTDVENAGGEWVDEEVVVDEGLVTSRNPDDLDAFTDALVDELEATAE